MIHQEASNCTSLRCPKETPYRCSDGYCAEDENHCLTLFLCPYDKAVRCDDGTCKGRNIHTGRSLCSTSLTCPDSAPYLCSDKSCASHPQYCPLSFSCPEGYYTCSDQTCSPTPCNQVTETLCPASRPIRCDNGFCTTSVLECNSIEGCMAPYECNFFLSLFYLIDRCFDGSCVSSFNDCPKIDCASLSMQLGLDYILTQCWNGDCMDNDACLPLPACPNDWPVRCNDGTCRKSPQECNSIETPSID